MSFSLCRLAWKVKGLKPAARLVLLYMCDVARDPEHEFFEAHEKTCAALGISGKTFAAHKKSLIADGHASLVASKRRVVADGFRDTLKIHPATLGDSSSDTRRFRPPHSDISPPTLGDSASTNIGNHLYPYMTPAQIRSKAFVQDSEATTGVSDL